MRSDAIVVMDTGSSDGTWKMANQFLETRTAHGITDPPVVLIPFKMDADETDIARDSQYMFDLVGKLLGQMNWDPHDESAQPVWVCYLMPDEFISNVTYVRPWLKKVEAMVVSCRRYEFWYSDQYYRGDRQYADENVLECPEIFIRYIPGKTSFESDRVPHHIPSRAPIELRKEPHVVAGIHGFADPRMFVKHYQFWDYQKCLQKAKRMAELGDSSQAQIEHVSRFPDDESVIKLLRKWIHQDILWNEQFAEVLKALPGYPPQPVIEP